MAFVEELQAWVDKLTVEAVISDMKQAGWDPMVPLLKADPGSRYGVRLNSTPEYFLSGAMVKMKDSAFDTVGSHYGIKVYWDGRSSAYEVVSGKDCSDTGTGFDLEAASAQLKGLRSKWEADIPELFAPWREIPEPGDFDAPFAQLRSAAVPLHSGGRLASGGDDIRDAEIVDDSEALADILATEDTLHDWLGDAAGSFNTNFMQLLPGTVQCQQDAILLALICVRSEREIWTRAQEELLSLARAGCDAMEASGAGGKSAERDAAVLGAVQFVVGFIPVVGKIVNGVVNGAKTADDLIQAFKGSGTADPPTNLLIGGDSASEVYSSIANELENGVAKCIATEELAINDLASELWQQMIDHPEIYDMSKKAQRLLNSDDPQSIVRPESVMVVPPDSLRKAANGPIRNWGKQTLDVSTKLEISGTKAAWSRESWIGVGPNGPLPQLDGMLEMLRRLLERFSVTLDATADHLVLAADGYETADANSQASLRENRADLREEQKELRETQGNRPPDVSSLEGNPWAEQHRLPGHEYVETPDGPTQVPSA